MSRNNSIRTNLKRQNVVQTLIILVIIVLVNIVGSRIFFRLDLTSEKRHTIAPTTKKALKEIDDVVLFKVYLDGDIPAQLKKLRNATREMLDGFRAYNKDIEYEFINPYAIEDPKDRDNFFQELLEKGIEGTNVQIRNEDGVSSKLIFPGAIATYRDREIPVQLLMTQSNMGVSYLDQINNSIEALEYNLLNAIRKMTVREKPKIAFVIGHDELSDLEVADFKDALSEYYTVSKVEINGKLNSLSYRKEADSVDYGFVNRFDAIVVAKPQKPIPREDQYMIDQFVMRGGKVLWLVDPVMASLDSLQYSSHTLGVPIDLGIEPMLGNYGTRINPDLLKDVNAIPIPVNVNPYGSEPRWEFFPWFYSPIIMPLGKHPIVRNLDAIKSEFVSSIDTLSSSPVKKTILLTTSEYTQRVPTPTDIDLSVLGRRPDERDFRDKFLPIAVLLEGNFNSLFRYRVIPGLTDNPDFHFLDKSSDTKMIVISDGDIARNQVSFNQRLGKPIPLKLGYDRYTERTYANKAFLLNAMNYLCDDEGVLEVRSRELKMRLLDQTKTSGSSRILWQAINVGIPVLLLLLTGLAIWIYRRRKYGI